MVREWCFNGDVTTRPGSSPLPSGRQGSAAMKFEQLVGLIRGGRRGSQSDEEAEAAAEGSPARPAPDAAPVGWQNLFGDETPQLAIGGQPEVADVPASHLVREAARRAAADLLAAFEVNAPVSNTGHKFTVHWADVTVFASVETVTDLLALAFFSDHSPFTDTGRDRFEEVGAAKFYRQLLKGPGGIFVKHDPTAGPGHCSVQLTGESFDVYGMACFARFLASVEDQQLRWHLTRIDLAFDGVEFAPRELYRELKKGNVRSNAERESITWHETPFGDDAGDTCNLGRRGSADHLRCYNRRATGTRVEHECRKQRAKWVGLQLVHTPLSDWHKIALGNLRDFLDLVKRRPGQNVTRAKLVPFWREFVAGVERCEVKISDHIAALKHAAEQTIGNVKERAGRIKRTAAKLYLALGHETFVAMVKRDAKQLHAADVSQVEDWRGIIASYCDAFALEPSFVFARAVGGGWGSS